MSIKSPSRMVGIPTYVESVAKDMAVTSTVRTRRKSRRLSIHPFVSGIVIECNVWRDALRTVREWKRIWLVMMLKHNILLRVTLRRPLF